MSIQIDFEHAAAYLAWPRINRWRGAAKIAAVFLPRTDSMRWTLSAVFALAAHGAVAASFLLSSQPNVIASPPPAAMDVDLVAPPSASEAVSSATPVGPDQLQAQAQPEPVPEQIEMPKFEPPPLERIAVPDAVVLQKIDPKPNLPRPVLQQKVAERTTARPTNVAKPDNVAAAPRSGAPSAAPSDAEQSWEQQILARLEREKRYPSEAQQQSLEDFVTVRFVVDRQGKVLSARIVHSNHYGPLDAEALAVFQRVTLAPPPDEAKGQTFDRLVRLHFFAPRRG
jgi:periplasmic protein TonB